MENGNLNTHNAIVNFIHGAGGEEDFLSVEQMISSIEHLFRQNNMPQLLSSDDIRRIHHVNPEFFDFDEVTDVLYSFFTCLAEFRGR